MSDEFDDDFETAPHPARPADGTRDASARLAPAPRVVARLYASADPSLRVKLLDCLVRPLGLLGLFGIAAGVFGNFAAVLRDSGAEAGVEQFARFTSAQVFELARFVEQVDPEALQQFANTLSDNGFGSTAFAAAAVALLVRQLARSRHRT